MILIHLRCYGDGWQPYPSRPDHVVLGMCTGQLAASAVASASTAGELVHLAVETVVIAFRTGLHVMRVRDILSNGEERCQSWSCVVSKLSVQDAGSRIERFSESKVGHPQTPCLNVCPLRLGVIADVRTEYAPCHATICRNAIPLWGLHLRPSNNSQRFLRLAYHERREVHSRSGFCPVSQTLPLC
jgi:hypothetical protein